MVPAAESERTRNAFHADFKIYHELMAHKVREILLVSSAYDAFIMEEDGSLASRIINEYSGLNLSQPPRVTRSATAREAVALLCHKPFDMVLTMPSLDEMDACTFGRKVKETHPDLPVILLSHNLQNMLSLAENDACESIDKTFMWTGNSDLLLAVVKNVEDHRNVAADTRRAQVRVLLLLEEAPADYSLFLPLIYKEIVRQTQVVLGSGLNEEHRLLKMRARPKILHARSLEEAEDLYRRYREYLIGVIADRQLPRRGESAADAGLQLLRRIRGELADLPLLLLSDDPAVQTQAEALPAVFLDKNAPHLPDAVHAFFLDHLGFGDFVFRLPDGRAIERAADLRQLEQTVARIPEASLRYHAAHNHFSGWLMGRSEIGLGSTFRAVPADEFATAEDLRRYIVASVRALRRWQQQGVVTQFRAAHFDADVMEFLKIGNGSLGGKARGLAFMSALLHHSTRLHQDYPQVEIRIPQTLVITTDQFEAFLRDNGLDGALLRGLADAAICQRFLQAPLPAALSRDLAAFLAQVRHPLSVRSSSLMEDAHCQPYAGLYDTFMIPNNHPDAGMRLRRLEEAVKRVYASTFYEGPRAFGSAAGTRPREDAMAVIIQALVGAVHGDFFYPTLAGVAQSHNYYPIGPMRAEEGVAHVALGFGKTVVEGERCLRFAPRYPAALPQFATVADMLANAQQSFYALPLGDAAADLPFDAQANLFKREVADAEAELPIKQMASTYIVEENRIRDSGYLPGPKVLTFAAVLKHGLFPLPELLTDLLAVGRQALGGPIEIEYAANIARAPENTSEFFLLQIRPMTTAEDRREIEITAHERETAFCYSGTTMGNGEITTIRDIVYVKPEVFQPDRTREMAEAVGRLNAELTAARQPYLLVGPGRWGSADPWLGIPVKWHQISGARAIVELKGGLLRAEASQGTHFFQNIASLGIPYLTVEEGTGDRCDGTRLAGLPVVTDTPFVRHVRTDQPLVVRIDGRHSLGVIRFAR
jgi:CheY-like chemotaxis protein